MEIRSRPSDPLTDRERALHLLGRFTMGVTADLLDTVRALGTEAWFDSQVEDRIPEDPVLRERLGLMGSLDLTCRGIMDEYAKPIPRDTADEERRRLNRLRAVPARELRESVLLRAMRSTNQLREVSADFFRNHFTVAVDKGDVRYFAVDYEREVVRAHALGNFGDMLDASARHPAMLLYLDNAVSRRPPTKAELKEIELRVRARTKSKEAGREAVTIAAQRGLNENYARELLELHTLGVDNYYTQRDVENVARALTGWTYHEKEDEPIEFRFRPEMHDKGDKKFLRGLIRDNFKEPVTEGEQVLDILKAHEGTAQFMSWKLCRHLVCDEPPADMVKRVAKVFRRTKGDLPAVYRAIATDRDFYDPSHYRVKFKRPFEFVVSAMRAVGAKLDDVNGILGVLESMNEKLYECKDPTGYYDQAEAWLDPGAFAVRWKFAIDMAEGEVEGVTVPDLFYEDLPPGRPDLWKEWLLLRLLPSGIDARVSAFLDRRVEEETTRGRSRALEPLARAMVGMILGSPAFQLQ